jgi:hypothetical protein
MNPNQAQNTVAGPFFPGMGQIQTKSSMNPGKILQITRIPRNLQTPAIHWATIRNHKYWKKMAPLFAVAIRSRLLI